MVIVCDIDNTLFKTELDKKTGKYNILSKNSVLIEQLNEHFLKKDVIIVHTGRGWDKFNDTVKLLKDNKIFYNTLVMGKPIGDIYIDRDSVRPGEFQ